MRTLEVLVTHTPIPGTPAALAMGALVGSRQVSICNVDQQFPIGDRADAWSSGVTPRSYTGAVNLAAAQSKAQWLLILEGEFFVESTTLARLLEYLSEADGEAVWVLERRLFTASDARPLADKLQPGGALLINRLTFMRLRGFDESIPSHIAGPDLVHRSQLAGIPVRRLGGHLDSAIRDPGSYEGSTWGTVQAPQIAQDLDIIPKRQQIYVNLREWSVPAVLRPPLITVAIATRNRHQYLRESIESVLLQSFQDFEIIVVDDGSDDDSTERVVQELDDRRVKYFREAARGISAARNRAADESAGWFTAVHDDDDLMLPWRLELGLSSFTEGVGAVYGSWANFDEDSGEMKVFLTKLDFGTELNAFSGQGPGHGTWLLPTHLIREHRYDEGLTSSVDHNLASRLAWAGVKWKHVEDLVFLRRVHAGQISRTEAAVQKAGHVLTLFANHLSAGPGDAATLRAAGKSLHFPKLNRAADPFQAYGAWLPDSLVRRRIILARGVTHKLFAMDMPPTLNYMLEERDANTGKLRLELGEVSDVSYRDLVRFRESGLLDLDVRAELRGDSPVEAPGSTTAPYPAILDRFGALAAKREKGGAWLLVRMHDSSQKPPELDQVNLAVRIAATVDGSGRAVVVGYWYADLVSAQNALMSFREAHPALPVQIFAPGRAAADIQFKFDGH